MRKITFIFFIVPIDKWLQRIGENLILIRIKSTDGKGHLANRFWRKKNEEEKVKMEG